MDVIGYTAVLGLETIVGASFLKSLDITYSAIYTSQSYHRSTTSS